jgi:hypothetical protein
MCKILECSFNTIKRTYNPHLHIITPNRKQLSISKRNEQKNRIEFNVGAKVQHLIKLIILKLPKEFFLFRPTNLYA